MKIENKIKIRIALILGISTYNVSNNQNLKHGLSRTLGSNPARTSVSKFMSKITLEIYY